MMEEKLEKSLSIDMEALIQPIAVGDGIIGRDFRLFDDVESPYLNLKDWRATARRLEREAANSEDRSTPPLRAAQGEWEDIAAVSDRVLREQSKDLEVASWYCEALLRLGGFHGLASGLELLARLIEEFWDAGLYPQEDEDGVDTRLAPLAGLIGRGVAGSLVQPIKLIPISDRSDADEVALWNIELAFAPARSASSESAERKGAEVSSVVQAIKTSSPEFLRWTRSGISSAQANLMRLMAAVNDKARVGGFASQVAAPLEAIAKVLDDNVGNLFVQAPEPATSDSSAQDGAEDPHLVGAKPAGHNQLMRRDEALLALERVAEYFDKAEPQGVIAGSIRDVVRRARLPMMDLFVELLPDEVQRAEFLMRAGIKRTGG